MAEDCSMKHGFDRLVVLLMSLEETAPDDYAYIGETQQAIDVLDSWLPAEVSAMARREAQRRFRLEFEVDYDVPIGHVHSGLCGYFDCERVERDPDGCYADLVGSDMV